MSVDTRLILSPEYNVEELIEVLERTVKTKVKVENTLSPNYTLLCFEANGVKRNMSVFTQYHVNGFTCTLLSLRANEQAVAIMQGLANVFGGFLQENDSTEEYDSYTGLLSPTDGLAFWVRLAIIKGIDHQNVIQLAEFIEKTKKQWSDK